MLGAVHSAAINAAGMLAPDGRCKALDASADGYGRGEAVAVFTLRHDNNRGGSFCGGARAATAAELSPALIRLHASSTNQDGRSSSLTAPNGLAQRAVIAAAAKDAAAFSGHGAFVVGGLSMHGTGTALGDPIEVSAIRAVLSSSTVTSTPPGGGGGGYLGGGSLSSSNDPWGGHHPNPLCLSASKSRAGHAEAAAGAVSILQVMGSLSQRQVAPLTHLRDLNPHVVAAAEKGATAAAAVRLMMSRATGGIASLAEAAASEGPSVSGGAVEPGGALSAAAAVGISSFAFMGSNVHIIVSPTVGGGGAASAPSPSAMRSTTDRARLCWERERLWKIDGPAGGCLLSAMRAAALVSPRTPESLVLHTLVTRPGPSLSTMDRLHMAQVGRGATTSWSNVFAAASVPRTLTSLAPKTGTGT